MTKVNHMPLGKLMVEKRSSINPSRYPDEIFDLYSVPAFDSRAPETLRGAEIGSAKKEVKSGDVLLSRIVPHIRRAWVVGTANRNRLIGSGEWMIFNSKHAWPDYLRHILVSDWFHPKLMQTVSGVGGSLLRARPSEVAKIEIPLPPFDEQKRIAAILDKADAIRRKRQQALRLTDDFLRSVFFDMFGDPVTNPKGWEIRDLNYVIRNSFRNGLSPSSKGTVAGKVLTLTAITTGSFSPEYAREAFFDRAPSENQLVTTNTFLICRGNGNKSMVGIGVFPEADMAQVAFPDTMIACTVDRNLIEPDYLQNLWSTAHIRTQIEAGARTTNGTYKVNQTLLGSIAFPLPPVSLQKDFSKIVKSLRSEAQKSALAAESSEDLFASLQQRAFRGEL